MAGTRRAGKMIWGVHHQAKSSVPNAPPPAKRNLFGGRPSIDATWTVGDKVYPWPSTATPKALKNIANSFVIPGVVANCRSAGGGPPTSRQQPERLPQPANSDGRHSARITFRFVCLWATAAKDRLYGVKTGSFPLTDPVESSEDKPGTKSAALARVFPFPIVCARGKVERSCFCEACWLELLTEFI